MQRTVAAVLMAVAAQLLVTAPAWAQPTIAPTSTCAYSQGRFAVTGTNYEPGQSVTVEVMATSDPLAGDPISGRPVTAAPSGDFNVVLDVPPTPEIAPVLRSVRVRANAAPSIGMPTLLAATPLKTVSRGVSVQPGGSVARGGLHEIWRLTGLPDGARMWAHYRRDGREVVRTLLGAAKEPCGRLRFTRRVLPRGMAGSGAWDLWITTTRAFRRPRKGVYVHRHMTVSGSGANARVRLSAPVHRLAPLDPRANAPVTNAFGADASQAGVISLLFAHAEGATVEFFERIGDRLKHLGSSRAEPGELTILKDATTWSCDRLDRRFIATATLADGTLASGAHEIRTTSCAHRFQLGVPRRIVPGGEARIRVVDRWGIGGIGMRLCVTPPAGERACRALALPGAVAVVNRRFRATRRGRWRVQLLVRGHRVSSSVAAGGGVGARAEPMIVLAAGDSTMQGVNGFIADELGETATVRSDIRPGFAISKSDGDWAQLAQRQADRLRPGATVVSVGFAEGARMTTPDGAQQVCCDEPWVAEYSRRVRLMMQTYQRGGRARVLWLTLPAPRGRRLVADAVNDAILRAAAGLAGVSVPRMDLLFTPNGYSDSIRYRGRTVRVREIDGIHLNVAGAAIAAKVIAQALRAG